MKTKGQKHNHIDIITLGCSKNLVDSEMLYSQLQANNKSVSHESTSKDGNIVVINTCGFIDNAKQESIDTILEQVERKRQGEIEQVLVTGCLSQRYRDDLKQEIPEVDAWFGTLELPSLLKQLKADYKHDLIGERSITTPSHYAYLKISEGCNRPCSFCAIPLMRGKHVSKTIEQLQKEAAHLVKNGVKEIMLIAQDSTYYGLDLYGERKLGMLLEKLAEVDGLDWIRLHYAFPSQFPEDALGIMVSKPNICKYLDMPLQHISDNMLKAMRRGITKKRTLELIEKIRNTVPEIAIRTTLLVGHPGETDQDIEELEDFVRMAKFERLGVFTYSHEENTHAGTLSDSLTQEEKDERANRIMAAQQEVSESLNKAKIGKTYKVLVDRLEGDFFIGRTEHDSPEVDNEVLINAKDNYCRIGDFVTIKITGSDAFDLYGEKEV